MKLKCECDLKSCRTCYARAYGRLQTKLLRERIPRGQPGRRPGSKDTGPRSRAYNPWYFRGTAEGYRAKKAASATRKTPASITVTAAHKNPRSGT